jgi:hypothetical protein
METRENTLRKKASGHYFRIENYCTVIFATRKNFLNIYIYIYIHNIYIILHSLQKRSDVNLLIYISI